MHCELVAPGAFAVPGARAPGLELLLARGRGRRGEPASAEGWLRRAFGLDDQPLAAGALTVLGSGGEPGGSGWARADPVHLRLTRDRLLVVPDAAFSLAEDEAGALAAALARHFGGELALQVLDARRWVVRLSEALAFDAGPALEAAGRDADLAARIGGEAGRRWSRLLNEAQMLLHAHPVNEAREARGEPAINSLWLWGAGAAPREAKGAWQSVSASDPVALGCARLAGARPAALPRTAPEWIEACGEGGRHLALLDALRAPLALGEHAAAREALDMLEQRWFAPLLAALREGRVGMVSLHVPEAAASFETVRGDLRRLWRRPRALAHYA